MSTELEPIWLDIEGLEKLHFRAHRHPVEAEGLTMKTVIDGELRLVVGSACQRAIRFTTPDGSHEFYLDTKAARQELFEVEKLK